MAQDSSINVLLVEDNLGDARLVELMLSEVDDNPVILQHVSTLKAAQDFLTTEFTDLVLLDLSLPDGEGLESIQKIQQVDDTCPIIILTGLDNPDFAVQSVHSGAQDYLVKGQGDGYLTIRAIRYAIERKRIEQRLSFLAHFDSLTSLANRESFHISLEQAIRHAKRNDETLSLLFLDLDHFKDINDTYGHAYGDELLINVAERLKPCLREEDIIARLGGDEFTIILSSINHADNAAVIAKKIVGTLAQPFVINDQQLFTSVSIGITLYPRDADSMEDLIKFADSAMYKAKQKGRNNFQFYTDDLHAEALRSMALKNDLRTALRNNELSLHYQPKVDTHSQKITGAEALIRWNHPKHGMISPVEFIPLAEQSNLIHEIGHWVIQEAMNQSYQWRQKQLSPICMAINLSAKQFQQSNLVELIEHELEKTDMGTHAFEFEITESLLMEEIQQTQNILQQLTKKGFRVSMDDFGTGYSSLSYLKRFPISTLKIDRSFIKDIPSDQDDTEIVKAIIAMAKALRLTVIAEGVETQQQLELLQQLDCDIIQGYLFSKPLPADQFEQLLRQEND